MPRAKKEQKPGISVFHQGRAGEFKRVSLPDIVGAGYGAFWRCTSRYRVVKGSRASKKSKTMALWVIVMMMRYPEANTLVIRKTYRTLRDSCFSDLKWAIHRLEVDDWWDCKENPLEITYRPTGQKILFRGMDDPLKITSISVDKGFLSWVWIEEAYEITSEADFDFIDESVRGAMPANSNLFKQITLTLNPWSDKHWIKKRFFDTPNDDVFAMTTNYTVNEWLDEGDKRVFERMKVNNPRRYRVAGLGEWGIVEGCIYENWEEKAFPIDDIKALPSVSTFYGLDFGYTNDPSAFVCGMIDTQAKTIWIYDEIYGYGMTNEKIFEAIRRAGYEKEKIVADSSEPKSIDRLRTLGLFRIVGAMKGKDSIRAGIDFIQDFHIIVHPRCVNFLTEISNYVWKKDPKTDKVTTVPEDDFNHLMDAMRYGLEQFRRPTVKAYRRISGLGL